jgi:hypothetical protein
MKKIDAEKQPGLAALKKKRPDVTKKMGFMKKGGMPKKMMGGGMMMDPNKKMMGGGMMGYSMGGEVLAKADEVIKMPQKLLLLKQDKLLNYLSKDIKIIKAP